MVFVFLVQLFFFSVHGTLLDRLGDQKDQVRDATVTLLTNIMDVVVTPVVSFGICFTVLYAMLTNTSHFIL